MYIQRSDTEDDWHWTESGDENDTQSFDEKSDKKVGGLLVENLPSNKIQFLPKVFTSIFLSKLLTVISKSFLKLRFRNENNIVLLSYQIHQGKLPR